MILSSVWRQWPTAAVMAAAVMSLWATTARAGPVAGDYFVRSLPGVPPGPLIKMHAGHIEVTPEHNGNLFFWHFQNKHIANRQRTVIWLNGGPGCSSEDGAMMEVGPYRLKDDHTLEYNEGSWHEFANIMFVDNPVGTGYSYVNTDSYLHELDDMADQFVVFLEKFFTLFPEYEQDDLYIAGESFAGQHIPYIAKHILERNKKPGIRTAWALKGLLIGNGWIAPREQYEAYIDYAYDHKLIDKNSEAAKRLENQRRICEKDIATLPNSERVDVGSCESILQQLLQVTRKDSGDNNDCLNMYDVRLRDSFPSCGMNWPPDLPNLTSYLRRKDVLAALHVNPEKTTGWQECNGNVGSQFRTHRSKPSITFMPDLLSEISIALFSGDQDLICNHLGTESLIANMKWNGGKGFELSPGNWAPRREWTFEGEKVGFWQEARNLTYILFYESSHMVPFDHPRRSRDMLDRFMGVDISSIGGKPTDSRLDGEPGPATSVGGGSGSGNGSGAGKGNGTMSGGTGQTEVDAAKWAAYRKSGEIVLVIVAVAAVAWGYFVWRDRRRRAGYRGVSGGPASSSEADIAMYSRRGNGSTSGRNGTALENFRNKRTNRDLEAGDFDEGELDDLHTSTPVEDARYSVGADSESEDEGGKAKPTTGGAGNSGEGGT